MARRQQQFQEETDDPRGLRRSMKPKVDAFNIMKIKPITENQEIMIEAFEDGFNIVAAGTAGTGKSYVATYLALEKLLAKKVEKIIIVRSAVNIRSQGFLPGSLEEKEQIFTIPYKNIVDELCQNGNAWECLTKKKFIQFISTSYIRGLTLKNCVVIVDEFQNMDSSECESMLTRLGENCQVILCGDTRQNDLKRKREESCYDWIMKLVTSNELEDWFEVVKFNSNDIVRGELCKAIIKAIEKM
ncbi:PhoH family protein [Candidatus Dojkabacteria bacterium]|jgi:phosphate starvation-inducible protein PhoH|nr:PhoH family protein [Candidatus Dojkabacteria bacterium]